MLQFVSSIALRVWAVNVWCFTQLARVLVLTANLLMFPRPRTQQPNPVALTIWIIVNAGIFLWTATFLEGRSLLFTALIFAFVHFLTIVAVLLVITEENDVWAGYVRFDRITGKGDRVFGNGRVVKSLPLMLNAGASYLCFSAIVVRAWHSESTILTAPYRPDIPILYYIITVAAQVPTFETILRWTGLDGLAMKFDGIEGLAVKYAIEISVVSIIIGAINSYFRQKSEVRRLVEALGSSKGNIPVLESQASRAPEEIKSTILAMALHDVAAPVRRRAMTVARYANILTFPTTIIYNLHRETDEQNKLCAIRVSGEIVQRNYENLDKAYFEALGRKIEFQLRDKRRKHGQGTLDALIKLRQLLKP
jgi:hypothetical protein